MFDQPSEDTHSPPKKHSSIARVESATKTHRIQLLRLSALIHKYSFLSVFFVDEIAFATTTAACLNMCAAIWHSAVCMIQSDLQFNVFFSRAITECRRVCKCEKKTAAEEKSELNAQ